MGNYVTEADVLQLMPQLPNSSGVAGYTATSDLITLAIRKAESKVDSYCAVKYSLPFSTVPVQVRDEALDLAVYYTYKYLYSQDNKDTNEFVERENNAKDNIFSELEKIRNGTQRLTLTNGSVVAFKTDALGVRASHADYQPVFDMDKITASQVDPDLLEEISDARD